MTPIQIKTILFSVLSSISFIACSTFPTASSLTLKQIEQVNNIDALPDTKTNIATLNQSKDHCVIQFTGYLASGESTETWEFKANQLHRAFSETYKYDQNSALNSITQKHALDPKTRMLTTFDIQKPEVQTNFNKLKSHFSDSALAQCN